MKKELKKKHEDWENYGDISPEHGGRYVKYNGYDFDVVQVIEVDNKLAIRQYCVNPDDMGDSWINKADVMSFIGMTEDDFDPMWFILGAVDYYGDVNFGADAYQYDYVSDENLEKRLSDFGITG